MEMSLKLMDNVLAEKYHVYVYAHCMCVYTLTHYMFYVLFLREMPIT